MNNSQYLITKFPICLKFKKQNNPAIVYYIGFIWDFGISYKLDGETQRVHRPKGGEI